MDWISLLYYSQPFFQAFLLPTDEIQLPLPAFLESILNLLCPICHISLYFSQHLNANHTSPFLSEYAWGLSAFSQPLSPIWKAFLVSLTVLFITCSWACIQRGSTYSRRAPSEAAMVVSLPSFSDYYFQKTSNVVTPEPLRIRMWWDEEEQEDYFEGWKS